MESKPRKQKDEVNPYARVTRNFLLKDLSCANLFDTFEEEAQNGSIIAIAGDDFALIAADARFSDEAKQTLHKISNNLVLGSTGAQCITSELASLLRARMFMNEYMRRRVMPSKCVALLLSCLLTNQRFYKNHVSIMLAGLDPMNGKGVVYAYNALGYHEKTNYRAMGAANLILQPILYKRLAPKPAQQRQSSESSQSSSSVTKQSNVKLKTAASTLSNINCKQQQKQQQQKQQQQIAANSTLNISFDEAFELIVCAFKKAVACQNVYTGNVLVITAITKEGCFTHEIILKDEPPCIEEWL